MPDKLAHVRGWFMKASNDLLVARQILASGGPYDIACFHAQQAVEKFMKGLLAFADRPIPRTHNLEELEGLCAGLVPAWPEAVDMEELTTFAVQLRYDFEFWPDREMAQKAVQAAEKVRDTVFTAVPGAARPENAGSGQ